jgi:hypothetical protein
MRNHIPGARGHGAKKDEERHLSTFVVPGVVQDL